MKLVGLDLGTRRVGVATSDSGGRVASPRCVVHPTGDGAADRAELARVVASLGPDLVVVGLPLSLDGREGPAARHARREAGALCAAIGVPVELHDERFTTVEADSAMRRAGRQPAARRTSIDMASAAVMLQSWIDRRASARG